MTTTSRRTLSALCLLTAAVIAVSFLPWPTEAVAGLRIGASTLVFAAAATAVAASVRSGRRRR